MTRVVKSLECLRGGLSRRALRSFGVERCWNRRVVARRSVANERDEEEGYRDCRMRV